MNKGKEHAITNMNYGWNILEEQKKAMGAFILIIDDEPDICRLLQLSLSKQGYRVKYVHGLTEGLQYLKHSRPDILFLDIHLPDGSGLDALPVIKKWYPDLTVITISAYDNGMEKQKALTAGAAHFLPKPFNVGKLKEIIYNVKAKH